MTAKKKLKIYKENDDYIIERINEFNHATKRQYSKAGLIEALEHYKTSGNLETYDIEVGKGVMKLVIDTLSKPI